MIGFILLNIILLTLISSQTYAQREIILSDSIKEYKIGKYSDILFDSSKKLTIKDVAYGKASKIEKYYI